MDTPTIDKLLAGSTEGSSHFTTPDRGNSRLLNLLHESVKGLEQALAAGVIYNTEYKDAYSYLSRASEEAFDQATAPFRGERDDWEQNDPRWYTVYHPAFANAGSAAKKLLKFRGTNPRVDALLPALEEAGKLVELTKKLKPLIQKGRKPNPNRVEPDLTNTATCAICQNRQKLSKNKTMVDHGFKISDGLHYYGARVGHCFGYNYQPYELSNEANKKFKGYLEGELARTREHLSVLKSGEVVELHILVRVREGFSHRDEPKTLHKGELGFDRELERRVAAAENQIYYLESDIKGQEQLIQDWKPNPQGVL